MSYSPQNCSTLTTHCTTYYTNPKSAPSFSWRRIILHHVLWDTVWSIYGLTHLKVASLLVEGLQQFVCCCATVSIRKPKRELSYGDRSGVWNGHSSGADSIGDTWPIQCSWNILLTYPVRSLDCLLAPEWTMGDSGTILSQHSHALALSNMVPQA